MFKSIHSAVLTVGLGLLSWQSVGAALVSYWDFNQSTSGGVTSLVDTVGNNDGTLYNANATYTTAGESGVGAEFVAGRTGAGNAMRFNDPTYTGATVDTVALGNSSFPVGKDDFTVSGWFNANTIVSTVSHSYILSNGRGNALGSGISLHLSRAGVSDVGKLLFTIRGNTGDDIFIKSSVRLDDSAWHWFAVKVDGEVASFYVDGVQQSTNVSYKATTSASPFESNTFVGARLKNTEGFNGLVDDVAVFDTALSSEDLNTLYTQGPLAIPEPEVIGLFGIGAVLVVLRRRMLR